MLKTSSLGRKKTSAMSKSFDMDWLSSASGTEEEQPIGLTTRSDKQSSLKQTLCSSLPSQHGFPFSDTSEESGTRHELREISSGELGVPVVTITQAPPAVEGEGGYTPPPVAEGGYFTMSGMDIQFADDGSDTEVAFSDEEALHNMAAVQGVAQRTGTLEPDTSPSLDTKDAKH